MATHLSSNLRMKSSSMIVLRVAFAVSLLARRHGMPTYIRLLNISTDDLEEETRFHCIDTMIPPVSAASTEALPMIVNTQELFVLPGHQRIIFFDASEDGHWHGRGFITLITLDTEEPQCDFVLYKFPIDASGEHCTAALSEPCELFPEDVFQYWEGYAFDGFRGRVNLLEFSGFGLARSPLVSSRNVGLYRAPHSYRILLQILR
ncbi:hypothetical protein JVU11DRAFT_6936 [Chiua virens]|nr:hypothetical protein JVU11DRAFT_6936 [Chiua virens]